MSMARRLLTIKLELGKERHEDADMRRVTERRVTSPKVQGSKTVSSKK